METLERCLTMIDEEESRQRGQTARKAEAYRKRFTNMYEFCELMNTMFDLTSKAGRRGFKPLVKALGKLAR